MDKKYTVKIWKKDKDLYQYTVNDRLIFSLNKDPEWFPVIIKNNEVIAMQPLDPYNNNEPWKSKQDALNWGKAWLKMRTEIDKNSNPDNTNTLPYVFYNDDDLNGNNI